MGNQKLVLGILLLHSSLNGMVSSSSVIFEERLNKIDKRIQQLVDEKEWTVKGTLRWTELQKYIAKLDEKFSRVEKQLSQLEKTNEPNTIRFTKCEQKGNRHIKTLFKKNNFKNFNFTSVFNMGSATKFN